MVFSCYQIENFTIHRQHHSGPYNIMGVFKNLHNMVMTIPHRMFTEEYKTNVNNICFTNCLFYMYSCILQTYLILCRRNNSSIWKGSTGLEVQYRTVFKIFDVMKTRRSSDLEQSLWRIYFISDQGFAIII